MRARLLAPLLLIVACGPAEVVSEKVFDVKRATNLLVTVPEGAVVVDQGGPDVVTVSATARGLVDVGAFVTVTGTTVTVVIADPAVTQVTVSVPTGVDVVATAGRHISLSGALGVVKATSKGGIDAFVSVIAGGELNSSGGDVVLVAQRPPTTDLTCRAAAGDASVTMPASFRGRAHVTTQTGACDVPADARMRATWGPDRKTVLLFAGSAMTNEERKEELDVEERRVLEAEVQVAQRSPQAIWVTSPRGTASFRLAEN